MNDTEQEAAMEARVLSNNSRPVQAEALRQKALSIALGWASAGLHEEGANNRGEQIDKIESIFGLEGAAWCAMFVSYCYCKALLELLPNVHYTPTVSNFKAMLPLLRAHYFAPSPSCAAIGADAKTRGILQHDMGDLQPGDIVLYDFEHSGTPHHIGLFLRRDGSSIVTVEGNTPPPGGSGNQADGGGVYIKERSPSVVFGVVAL